MQRNMEAGKPWKATARVAWPGGGEGNVHAAVMLPHRVVHISAEHTHLLHDGVALQILKVRDEAHLRATPSARVTCERCSLLCHNLADAKHTARNERRTPHASRSCRMVSRSDTWFIAGCCGAVATSSPSTSTSNTLSATRPCAGSLGWAAATATPLRAPTPLLLLLPARSWPGSCCGCCCSCCAGACEGKGARESCRPCHTCFLLLALPTSKPVPAANAAYQPAHLGCCGPVSPCWCPWDTERPLASPAENLGSSCLNLHGVLSYLIQRTKEMEATQTAVSHSKILRNFKLCTYDGSSSNVKACCRERGRSCQLDYFHNA